MHQFHGHAQCSKAWCTQASRCKTRVHDMYPRMCKFMRRLNSSTWYRLLTEDIRRNLKDLTYLGGHCYFHARFNQGSSTLFFITVLWTALSIIAWYHSQSNDDVSSQSITWLWQDTSGLPAHANMQQWQFSHVRSPHSTSITYQYTHSLQSHVLGLRATG